VALIGRDLRHIVCKRTTFVKEDMLMTLPDRLPDVIPDRKIAGLTTNLWRLALVIGVGQFSMSVWSWQFGIFIETLIEPWQMGLTFTASSIAGILGVPLSGYVSDFIGRRKTLLIAYIPMAIGLFLTFLILLYPRSTTSPLRHMIMI